MRRGLVLTVAVMLAACGSPPRQSPAAEQTPIDPAAVVDVRSELPAGYEVGDLHGPLSAAALWGFGSGWTADPQQCMPLADPAPRDSAAQGISASGPGGTVFVLVAASPLPGTDLITRCDRWSMRYGHTGAEVTRGPSPQIEGATTLSWQAVARTVVESGSATLTNASSALAYLDRHVVVVTVVTDPGSPHPALDPDFADGLLAAAVTRMRVH